MSKNFPQVYDIYFLFGLQFLIHKYSRHFWDKSIFTFPSNN